MVGSKSPPTFGQDLGAVPEQIDKEYEFLSEYMSLESDQRSLIGHKFEDLVKACSFRERDCKNSR